MFEIIMQKIKKRNYYVTISQANVTFKKYQIIFFFICLFTDEIDTKHLVQRKSSVWQSIILIKRII